MSVTHNPAAAAALRAAVVDVLLARVTAAKGDARGEAHTMMAKGDRLTAVSPLDGSKIASVSKSAPKPVATVTDGPALDGWIEANYPDNLRTVTEITGNPRKVVEVLAQHAPEMLTVARKVPEWARNEVLLASQEAGIPCGPGGELDDHAPPGVEVASPAGTVSIRKAPDADRIVENLWQSGLIELDGTPRELPEGDQ